MENLEEVHQKMLTINYRHAGFCKKRGTVKVSSISVTMRIRIYSLASNDRPSHEVMDKSNAAISSKTIVKNLRSEFVCTKLTVATV